MLRRGLCTLTRRNILRDEGALHVIGGVACFVATERLTAAMLDACALKMPSSVTALCALGVAAACPSRGAALQRALGPAAAWLRATLPCTLVPAFLFPAVCELPETEALPKLAVLASGSILATCLVTGQVAAALVRGVPPPIAAPCARSTATALGLLSSAQTALVALVGGLSLSCAATLLCRAGDTSEAQLRTPAYIGATVAAYVAATRLLPPSIRTFVPPNVGCALVLLPLLLTSGGSPAVRTYLDGAGAALLASVQPAIVTLGLYTHTHRAMMQHQRLALCALAAVVAPALLFGVAWAGAAMEVEPMHVASLLPASTTTGLALTWPSGFALCREEYVAAGTAFNSGVVQVTLPALLWVTGLRMPLSRGVGVGSTAHIGGMAALAAAGEAAAADAAAVVLVVVGVARSVLVQMPGVSRSLASVCEGGRAGDCTDDVTYMRGVLGGTVDARLTHHDPTDK